MLRDTPIILSVGVLLTLAILYWLAVAAALVLGSMAFGARFLGVTPIPPPLHGADVLPFGVSPEYDRGSAIEWGRILGAAAAVFLYAAWIRIRQGGYAGPPFWGRLEITAKLVLTLALSFGMGVACWWLLDRIPAVPFLARLYVSMLLAYMVGNAAIFFFFPEDLPDSDEALDAEERGDGLLDQERAWERMGRA